MRPQLAAPDGATDTHMHITYPVSRFPVAHGEDGFAEHTAAEYLDMAASIGITRYVVAQTPPYHYDPACVIAAVAELGDNARGAVAVAGATSQADIERLHAQGIRGATFHMLPNGFAGWAELPEVAAKVADFGWHVDVQLDGTTLPEHRDKLTDLPCPLVIDHCGKFLQPGGLAHAGVAVLLDLVAAGNTYVKLSAPYETTWDDPPYMKDSGAIARAVAQAAPERCLWASNWPHLGCASRDQWPSEAMLLDTLLAWTDDDAARRKILVDNPARLYGF